MLPGPPVDAERAPLPSPGRRRMTGALESEVVRQAMRTARELTGLELAYVSEFRDGALYPRALDGDEGPFGLALDDPLPLEGTFCQRVVDGRLAPVVPDTAADATTAALPVTAEANIGAYVGVPVRLPDGGLYGTLCCVGQDPAAELDGRHADLLRMLARLVGDQLGRARADHAVQRAQNELLATVSTDLRGPLVAIEELAGDLAAGRSRATPERAAAVVGGQARRALARVDDMLLVARQRSGALRLQAAPADLALLVREAAADAALAGRTDGDRIATELPATPVVADVDAALIAQLLRNLIENALKYSPGGGPVVVRLQVEGPVAVVSVSDHGIGFSLADAGHLGESFYRAPAAAAIGVPGLGLGLATALAIATLHEGTLSAASEPGVGSTFTVRLPRTHALRAVA